LTAISTLLLALLLLPAAASAEGILISSGAKGGYYHNVGRGLRVVLERKHDVVANLVPSHGSIQNLEALDDPNNPVNVALVQADALDHYLAEHPEFAGEYTLVTDAGRECAFVVTTRAGKIGSLADLAAPGERKIAVGEPGSGPAVTWAALSRLSPELQRAKPIQLGMIEALLALAGDPKEGPVAALAVQRPLAGTSPLEIVVDNQEAFRIVPIRKDDLGEIPKAGDAPVYSFEKVRLGFGRDYKLDVETLCTRALVLAARGKLSAEELEAVGKAMLGSRRFIIPGGR
jgi:TRAP-type uncharacterized transport system substrate-binding protein